MVNTNMANKHKNKGDAFEREVAAHLSEHTGLPIQRMPMSGSFSLVAGSGGADLTGAPGIWFECKRVEKLSFPDAMAQAKRGTTAHGNVDMPVVINRRSRQSLEEAYTLMQFKDFIILYNAWLELNAFKQNAPDRRVQEAQGTGSIVGSPPLLGGPLPGKPITT